MVLVYDVQDLVKYYPDQMKPANNSITLQIHEGEIFDILGPGSGSHPVHCYLRCVRHWTCDDPSTKVASYFAASSAIESSYLCRLCFAASVVRASDVSTTY